MVRPVLHRYASLISEALRTALPHRPRRRVRHVQEASTTPDARRAAEEPPRPEALRAIARAEPSSGTIVGWAQLADVLVAEASESSLHPSERWQRSPEAPGADASLQPRAARRPDLR
ncbi:hypothetical protein GCM10007147_37730 [Nocardiopsis kunsanensis]|uniref:Uncharacterized protein n=1 Tax=Nocardiopsis kunsanensis TaxID=141693 RepID=A0A918XI68_9ACTN|nr:hypothetical protein GCM10007147_37730 [Nocardiopsis kunsanensis]